MKLRQIIGLKLLILYLLTGCKTEVNKSENYRAIHGETMGTTYTVVCDCPSDYKSEIDDLLVSLNDEVSVYEKESLISRFNRSSTGIDVNSKDSAFGIFFLNNFNKSVNLYEITQGTFDPTVMPLVNYWGFGYLDHQLTSIDSFKVDSLQNLVGMDKLTLEKNTEGWSLKKSVPELQLDFGGLAKGYGVDVVSNFLDLKKVNNYLVEIGREVGVKGLNPKGMIWKIGINTPSDTADVNEIFEVLQFENKAIATSGNYRNYYKLNNRILSHTINPATGFPERNNLLSASVIANDCMTADALATACMVLGLEEAFQMIESLEDTEGFFIYSDEAGNLIGKKTYN